MKPIEGSDIWETVSLESTVDPLVSLVLDIEEMVSKAKQKCDQPKDDLTTDESALVMLYSME